MGYEKVDMTPEARDAANHLEREGIVSEEDAHNVVEAGAEREDELQKEAIAFIAASGGSMGDAKEEAELAGNTALAEKIQVMMNKIVKSSESTVATGQSNEVLDATNDTDADVARAEKLLAEMKGGDTLH